MTLPAYISPEACDLPSFLAILQDVKLEFEAGRAHYICLSAEYMTHRHGVIQVRRFTRWINMSIDYPSSFEAWLHTKGLLNAKPSGANILEQRKISMPLRMAWIDYLLKELQNEVSPVHQAQS